MSAKIVGAVDGHDSEEPNMQAVTTIACATSHHWSRELKGLGHSVRLMPPAT